MPQKTTHSVASQILIVLIKTEGVGGHFMNMMRDFVGFIQSSNIMLHAS